MIVSPRLLQPSTSWPTVLREHDWPGAESVTPVAESVSELFVSRAIESLTRSATHAARACSLGVKHGLLKKFKFRRLSRHAALLWRLSSGSSACRKGFSQWSER